MASKINKGEILAKFFDDGEYTALFIRMARLSP